MDLRITGSLDTKQRQGMKIDDFL